MSIRVSRVVAFRRAGKTKYVGYGFSWSFFFCGWLAFFVRGRWFLTAVNLAVCVLGYFAIGTLLVVAGMPVDYAVFTAFFLIMTFNGLTGNYLLARDLMIDGWQPMTDLPLWWNIPKLFR